MRAFRRLIDGGPWQVDHFNRKPIGSIGRGVQRCRWPRLVAAVAAPLTFALTFVTGIQAWVLRRITGVFHENG